MEATLSSLLSLLSAEAIEFDVSENKILCSETGGLRNILTSKDSQMQVQLLDNNKNAINNSSYITLNGHKENSFENGYKEKNGNCNNNEKSVKDDKSYIMLNGNKSKSLVIVNSKKDKMVINNSKEKIEDGIPVPKQIIYSGKIQVSWRQPRKIGAGLENLGNTCFMNTVIQCLTYCPPLTNHLLYDTNHHSKCSILDFCMMCALQNHIKKALNNSNNVIRPMEVFKNLRKIAKHFQHGRQEDAHEFLRYVIENLWRSCLLENNISSKLDSASKETTIINQIFGGYHRSQVVCSRCNERSNTYDHFMDFILDIKQNVLTLDAALKKFTEPEVLDSDNAYKCPKCKMKVQAFKKFTVHKAPNVATFQLKRFDYNRFHGGKITKQITYPDVLNLRPYMSENKGDPVLYRLNAVLVHSGSSCNSGHYFCYVKNSDGQWFLMDDSRVTRTNIQHVLSQSAYVLFYIKSTPSEALPKKSFENGIVSKKIDTNVCNNKRISEVSSPNHLVQNNQFKQSNFKQKQPLYPTINLNKRNGLSPNVNNKEKVASGNHSQTSNSQEVNNKPPPNKIQFHVNPLKVNNHQTGLVPYIEDSSESSDDNDTVKLISSSTPSTSKSISNSNSSPSSSSMKPNSFTSFNIKRKPVLNVNRLSNSGLSNSTSPKVIATSVWTVTDVGSCSPGADSNSSVHSTTDWHVTPSDSERQSSEVEKQGSHSPSNEGKSRLSVQNGNIDPCHNNLNETTKQCDFRKQGGDKNGDAEEDKCQEKPFLKRKCIDSNQESHTNSKLHDSEGQSSPVFKKVEQESDILNSNGPQAKKFKCDSDIVKSESVSVLDSPNKLTKLSTQTHKNESPLRNAVSPSRNSESSYYKTPNKTDRKYEVSTPETLKKEHLNSSKNNGNCSSSSNSSLEYEWVEKTNDSIHRPFKVSCTPNFTQEV